MTDDEVKEHLSANLQRLLSLRGWTGVKLAQESGESQPTISRLLHGDHVPKVGTLTRVAAALDTSVDYLLSDPQAASKPPRKREFVETA
ncbi:helix-turn-helix domain-containing protein [Planctellipticum variicoloris]|uniref:helix-turn-helix domain-containing protein n=1 Tax=Planctellipticum variicoloris TaxID=3064265 RepID=UPI003013CB08|nr:helix-turn-helix domain-containing protein [Planctomycetaceae bacterium SH412]